MSSDTSHEHMKMSIYVCACEACRPVVLGCMRRVYMSSVLLCYLQDVYIVYILQCHVHMMVAVVRTTCVCFL